MTHGVRFVPLSGHTAGHNVVPIYMEADVTGDMRMGDRSIDLDRLEREGTTVWEAVANFYDTLDILEVVVSDRCYEYPRFNEAWEDVVSFATLYPPEESP